jgi:hypothetical protein
MRKIVGWILFLVGSWMLVSPQALIGVKELSWMSKCAFSGEVLPAILVTSAGYYLLELKPRQM